MYEVLTEKSALRFAVRHHQFTRLIMSVLDDQEGRMFLSKPHTHDKNTCRIYHRSLMQTEKSLPEGKRIMPETRFTEFLALSVHPKVGISRSAFETDV